MQSHPQNDHLISDWESAEGQPLQSKTISVSVSYKMHDISLHPLVVRRRPVTRDLPPARC